MIHIYTIQLDNDYFTKTVSRMFLGDYTITTSNDFIN
jgi:hypothetical protein